MANQLVALSSGSSIGGTSKPSDNLGTTGAPAPVLPTGEFSYLRGSGTTIVIGKRVYPHSLDGFKASRTYDVSEYKRFTAVVGFEDKHSPSYTGQLFVEVDGRLVIDQHFDHNTQVPVDLDLDGASSLKIEVIVFNENGAHMKFLQRIVGVGAGTLHVDSRTR